MMRTDLKALVMGNHLYGIEVEAQVDRPITAMIILSNGTGITTRGA